MTDKEGKKENRHSYIHTPQPTIKKRKNKHTTHGNSHGHEQISGTEKGYASWRQTTHYHAPNTKHQHRHHHHTSDWPEPSATTLSLPVWVEARRRARRSETRQRYTCEWQSVKAAKEGKWNENTEARKARDRSWLETGNTQVQEHTEKKERKFTGQSK